MNGLWLYGVLLGSGYPLRMVSRSRRRVSGVDLRPYGKSECSSTKSLWSTSWGRHPGPGTVTAEASRPMVASRYRRRRCWWTGGGQNETKCFSRRVWSVAVYIVGRLRTDRSGGSDGFCARSCTRTAERTHSPARTADTVDPAWAHDRFPGGPHIPPPHVSSSSTPGAYKQPHLACIVSRDKLALEFTSRVISSPPFPVPMTRRYTRAHQRGRMQRTRSSSRRCRVTNGAVLYKRGGELCGPQSEQLWTRGRCTRTAVRTQGDARTADRMRSYKAA